MSSFDYAFAYEDRDEVHTSRWVLSGVNTTSAGNVTNGRLWMTAADSADTVTVNVYKDPACGAGDKVASGTCDISGIADASVKCTLSAANSSGLTGEFYFEKYTSDPTVPVEVLVSLAMDAELALEYGNIADLPAYDATTGMATYLAAATKKTLLLASQLFRDQMGGYGAPENRYKTLAGRDYPDYRALANPDQLQDACVHWALMLALGRSHERSRETMYSQLRDHHDQKRREAIDSWNIAFNTDPDDDEDADEAKNPSAVSITRL